MSVCVCVKRLLMKEGEEKGRRKGEWWGECFPQAGSWGGCRRGGGTTKESPFPLLYNFIDYIAMQGRPGNATQLHFTGVWRRGSLCCQPDHLCPSDLCKCYTRNVFFNFLNFLAIHIIFPFFFYVFLSLLSWLPFMVRKEEFGISVANITEVNSENITKPYRQWRVTVYYTRLTASLLSFCMLNQSNFYITRQCATSFTVGMTNILKSSKNDLYLEGKKTYN